MKNALVGHLLAERGWTQAKLAAAIGSSRAHVSLVLNNTPGRGYRTRKKLAPLLTARELDLLGWDAIGQLRGKGHVEVEAYDTPFGRLLYKKTLFPVERSNSPA